MMNLNDPTHREYSMLERADGPSSFPAKIRGVKGLNWHARNDIIFGECRGKLLKFWFARQKRWKFLLAAGFTTAEDYSDDASARQHCVAQPFRIPLKIFVRHE
jgi:hypothetical protein